MSLSNPPKNPPQYSIRDLLLNLISEYRELDFPANPELLKLHIENTETKIDQLIYSQVLELIGESEPYDTDEDVSVEAIRNDLRAELRAKAKAKYIGGDSE